MTCGKQNRVEITMYKRYFSCFWVFVSTSVYNSLKVGIGLCYRFFVFNKNDIITKVLCLAFHRTRWRKTPHFLSLLIRFTSCCCKQIVCSQPDIIFHHINTLLFLGVWGGGSWSSNFNQEELSLSLSWLCIQIQAVYVKYKQFLAKSTTPSFTFILLSVIYTDSNEVGLISIHSGSLILRI